MLSEVYNNNNHHHHIRSLSSVILRFSLLMAGVLACIVSSIPVIAGSSNDNESGWNNNVDLSNVFADDINNSLAQPDSDTSDNEENIIFTVTPFTRFIFSSDIEGNANDDFRVWRSGIKTGMRMPVSDTFTLNFNLDLEYNNYDFDAPNNFIAGANEPFGDIQIFDVGVLAQVLTGEKWSWFAGVSGRYAGESGVDISDAGMVGAKAGIGYQVSENLTASMGVYITSQIEDDALVLPAFSVDWAIKDKWKLKIKGTGGLLSYELNDNLSLGLGAAWENRRFRLSDNSLKNAAVIEDTAIPVFVTLDYNSADQKVLINVNAGVITSQEFQIEDRNGNNQRNFDSDPTGFVGMNVKFVF